MPTTLITRPTAAEAAIAAAGALAATLRGAVAARGIASVAFSGGSTPGPMFDALAAADLDWSAIQVFQVDERIVAAGDPDRNLTQLRSLLLEPAHVPTDNIHVLPVDAYLAVDPSGRATALQRYCAVLATTCDGILDVVHLGLGDDGHTASLVPRDPVLDIVGVGAAGTGPYNGHSRLTLTYDALNRARLVLWLVAGASKEAVLPRLLKGDDSIPAGRVRAADAVVFCDDAAASGVTSD